MSTFNPPADIAQITLAKSSDVNAIKAATTIAFGLLPSETKLQRGTVNFAVDTGTANSYVTTLDASITTYTDGLQVVFRPLNSNTGTSTLNLNGLGAKSIVLTNSDPIQAGDISAGAIIDVRYSTATGFFHLTPNSAIYAHDAGVSADAAAASASAASSSASSAATSASNASTSASTATTQATNASTSATTATTQAGIATTQATNASTSATNAATSATTATTQAGIATTQATNAATSATAAAASYDSFDDRYLGVKTSDPTVDNDGNALLVGALYWNSATSVFKVWSGSVWITNLTSNQFGTNVATFLQTPSSANLATALTDEIGTAGKVVFDTNPTFPAQINLTANSGYNIYATGTAPNYMAGDLTIGSTLTTGVGVSTGGAGFELGANRTGNGPAFIDFHSTIGTDYDCRIIRDSGANGALQIVNTGTGDFQLQASGAAPMTFLTNATERIRIESSGNVGIGGTPSADAKFEISGTYPSSGTVSRVIRTTGTIPSTTTGTARMFGSEVNTQAAAFNISSLQHFSAIVNSIGAGSTISNQFGVLVDGSLTDAVNNFGFYGGINASAGTTRYNLYMAGSADNYLAGNLGVGVVPVSSITAVGAGQTTASLNTAGTLGGTLIVGDSGTSVGNGGAIVFSGASTTWRFAAIKGMTTNGGSNSQGDLVFSVRPSATDATLTEAFRIGSSKNATFAGSVGIGGTPIVNSKLYVGGTISGGVDSYGTLTEGTFTSSVTGTGTVYATSVATENSATGVAGISHYSTFQGTISGGSRVTPTNQYGFSASGTLTGAVNNYGFYGGIAASAGTTRYNLYMAGTADNYLAGSLGIGTTPTTGASLHVGKYITGSTNAFGIVQNPTILSDVTTQAFINRTNIITQSASFTLTNLSHYDASFLSLGSGSSITFQYGFIANSSLTTATNNYGFYGGIASGTGRYNLYMAGTADNYLAGDLTIGSTLSTGVGVTTGDASFELGGSRTGNGPAYIDIHSTVGTDYDCRILRDSGANGVLQIINTGTGDFQLQASGAAPMTFFTNATERIRIHESTGNVGIGTSSPDASAILDAQSTTKGVRFPNMTTTQKNAISSPAAGLVVFDTTSSKLSVYTGAAWQTITSA